MDIFSLAHRFGMDDLLRACAEVLDECINCDDVCRVLEAVEYYQDEVLEAKCWDLIKESTPRCTLFNAGSRFSNIFWREKVLTACLLGNCHRVVQCRTGQCVVLFLCMHSGESPPAPVT